MPSHCKQPSPYLSSTDMLGNEVAPSSNVGSLRAVFDSKMAISDHVSQDMKSTLFSIRDLHRICTLLGLVALAEVLGGLMACI